MARQPNPPCMEKHEHRAQPPSADQSRDASRPAHAGTLIEPWRHLGRQLVPLIGETGFGALFGRTKRLVAPRHAWLSVDTTQKTSAMLLTTLEQELAAVDGAVAAAANEELMSTFTRQLGALIGPSLTTRLLAETANAKGQQQDQEEHKQ
jgi:hypothetical protein